MTKVDREELQKATEVLLNLDLPVPQEAQDFFELKVKPSIGRGFEFAEHVCEYNGRLLQRVFCFQLHGLGGRKPSMREVGRRYEGGKFVYSNIYGGYMQSYRADDMYNGSDMHSSGWVPRYSEVLTKGTLTFESPFYCLNEEEWLRKYPYCAWGEYKGRLNFFQYLCKYRKENKIELLVKAGYPNFVACYNQLNISGRTFEDIFKIKQPFAKEYLKTGNIKDLQALRKYNWIDDEKKLGRYFAYIEHKRRYGLSIEFSSEEIKYCITSEASFGIYADYLKAAKELGYPLNENKYHFPKDLTELKRLHDKATSEVKIVRTKKNDAVLKDLASKYQKLSYQKNGLMIFPASCTEELIHESEALRHCVRTKADEIVSGKLMIMFIRKVSDPGTPFVTLGLVQGRKVNDKQELTCISEVRAYQNNFPDPEVALFVKDWKAHCHLTGWAA